MLPRLLLDELRLCLARLAGERTRYPDDAVAR
jgi:hypothetical protein